MKGDLQQTMPHLQSNGDTDEKASDTHIRTVSASQPAVNIVPDSSLGATKETLEISLSVSGRQVSASPDESTRPTASIESFES